MNGKALERDLSTHTNHKYNAWIERVVSDESITYREGILHLTTLISVGPEELTTTHLPISDYHKHHLSREERRH